MSEKVYNNVKSIFEKIFLKSHGYRYFSYKNFIIFFTRCDSLFRM